MRNQFWDKFRSSGIIRSRPWAFLFVAVVSLLGLLPYLHLYKAGRPNLSPMLKNLRPGEGRFAELPYAPLNRGRHSRWDIRRFNSLLRRDDLSPRTRAALLVLDSHVVDAITTLKSENLKNSNDYTAQADLAAAYIAKGDIDGQYYDYIQALKFADSAEKINPLAPVTRFNLALALERSYLLSQAQAEWKRYLALDSSSGWGKEALIHLRSLRLLQESKLRPRDSLELVMQESSRQEIEAYIRLNPGSKEALTAYAEEGLFSRWVFDQLRGHYKEAQKDLDSLRVAGTVLVELDGDRFLADSVEAIDKSGINTSFSRFHSLVKGHEYFARGLSLFNDGKESAACIEFIKASKLLRSGGSPFWLAATVNAANSAMYAGHPEGAAKLIYSIDGVIRGLPFTSLKGRSHWVLGVARLRLSDLIGSRASYMEALSLFEQVYEPVNIGALHCLIAENLRFQGDSSGAWRSRHEALKNSLLAGSALWLHNSIFDAAESLLKAHEPGVALRFQSELVMSPLCPRDPISLSESFIRRARSYLATGDTHAAVLDLNEANKLLVGVNSYPRRLPLEADISMAMGESCLGTDPSRSVSFLTKAIDYYVHHNKIFRLPGLLQKRASALIALGRFNEAEADLAVGINEVSAQAEELMANPLQEEYRAQSRELFDAAVEFQVRDRRDTDKAFCYAEISRQRYQGKYKGDLSRACRLDATSLDRRLERLGQALPGNTSAVAYYLLKDKLLVWMFDHNLLRFTEVSVDREYLRGLVEEFIRIASTEGETSRLKMVARELSSIMMPFSVESYRIGRRIIFVPDGFLFGFPFAALDDGTGDFLVSKHIVSVSPSLDLIFRKGRRRLESGGGKILVVGDPAFDRKTMADLPVLPSSKAEIREVCNIFPTAKLLEGKSATRDNVLSSLPRFSVVHISSHASISEDYPLLSFIALAGEGNSVSSNSLRVRDIYGLDLRRVRLVVLAACNSVRGSASDNDRVAYFAQAFLNAGSAAIAGSLWEVSDQDSRDFFHEFYRSIRSGSDVFAAMHNAQVVLGEKNRNKPGKPLAWAAFTIIGST